MALPTEPKEVNKALLGMCSVIRGLFAGAAHDEVLTRHRLGEVLVMIRSMPRTYGQHSVQRVATETGMTVATLYRHIAVAECWTPAELASRMDRTNRFGQPLSWSHLVALTAAPDAEVREFLLEECLASAWSVRALKEEIARLAGAVKAQSHADALRGTLVEGIDSGDRAVADVSVFTTMLAERLGVAETPPDEDLVARAIATLEELQERTESALAQLRVATYSEQRVRCPPSHVATDPMVPLTDEDEEEPEKAQIRRALGPPEGAVT